jgi:hypothetical protein
VNIELDGIRLIWRNQPGSPIDVRTVTKINTADRRAIVEHEIPGMQGNVFQDLGREPVRISFDGSFHGETAKNTLEMVRSKYKQGVQLPFNSDISGASDVTKVVIEEFVVKETAGIPEMFEYTLVLREYKEPPPEPTTPPTRKEEAKEWLDKEAEKTRDSINVVTGKVLDGNGKAKPGVSVLLKSATAEYKLTTNGEGVYRKEDVPAGTYRVTVEDKEYEGIEETVAVGSGGGEGESSGTGPEEEGGGSTEDGEPGGEPGGEDESGEQGSGKGSEDESGGVPKKTTGLEEPGEEPVPGESGAAEGDISEESGGPDSSAKKGDEGEAPGGDAPGDSLTGDEAEPGDISGAGDESEDPDGGSGKVPSGDQPEEDLPEPKKGKKGSKK